MKDPTETYRMFADFYDLYVGNFTDDLDFYKTYCDRSNRIIEIGCGTGRILEYFLRSDFQLVGVDASQEMLRKAEEKLSFWTKSGKLRLYRHDFANEKLNDNFDRALLTFYTFNYVIDQPAAFLKNVYRSLDDNGLILIDLFYPNSLYDKTIDNVWIERDYSIDGNSIRIRDNRHVVDDIERRQQIFLVNNREIKIDTDRKYYTPGEMKGLLEKAGFKDIMLSPEYDLSGFKSMIDESELKKNYIVKARK